MLTVCTLKDALMLLLKGAAYLETPKHDSVVKVQAIWWRPDGRLLLANQKQAFLSSAPFGPFIPRLKIGGFLARSL